tara:strand:- start:155 stop:262 length:108 start_codon:yes stop_codon:yes gene_type:complete
MNFYDKIAGNNNWQKLLTNAAQIAAFCLKGLRQNG